MKSVGQRFPTSLAAMLLCAIAGVAVYLASAEIERKPASVYPAESFEEISSVQGAKEQPQEIPATQLPPEPVQVETGEEIPVLGQKLRLREIRGGSGDREVRNLEFVFRQGILPRRLFDHNRNLIVNYRQLYRNSVGYGAATVFISYEVVSRDSDGDGQLSHLDRVDVAVSRPDGSEYRVVDQNLEQVFRVEYFPVENALQIELKVDGTRINRTYAL